MSEKRAELLLACVIIARSTSFVFNKLGLGTMTAFNLLAVRFLLAFVLLALLFWKRLRHISRRTVGRGALLGRPVLRSQPRVCHHLRRGAPAGENHTPGAGGHPAHPRQSAAAPFYKRKEMP